MYALSPTTTTTSSKKTTPNLLPCTISHNGPISVPQRYWDPKPSKTTTTTPTQSPSSQSPHSAAYFRGRLLQGRTLTLPEGYTGLVLNKTETPLPKPRPTAEQLRVLEEDAGALDEEFGGDEVEVKRLECQGRFDEVVVWGHEMVPDGEDGYVRGVEEWIGFAEAVSCSVEFGGEEEG